MNFNQLHYFVKIVEQRSVSKAATVLFMTQPALTLSMQSLETELGFQLYTKTSYGVEPTKEGWIFYEDAQNILKYLDKWESLRREREDQLSVVDISMVNAIYYAFSERILMRCCEAYQDIGLNLTFGTWDDLSNEFEEGKSRIILNACPKEEYEKIMKLQKKIKNEIVLLGKDHTVVYLNTEDPLCKKKIVTSEDLEKHKIVKLLTSHKVFPDYASLYQENGIYLKYFPHVMSYIAKNTTGYYALLPSIIKTYCTEIDFRNIVTRPVCFEKISTDFYLYMQHPGKGEITEAEKKVITLIRTYFSEIFGRCETIESEESIF